MAAHDTAFRSVLPDQFHARPDDTSTNGTKNENPASLADSPAEIVSLQAYKAIRSLKHTMNVEKIHDPKILLPLINEAHLRPVRFYRGLEEWLLGQEHQKNKN
jgi:hypothetical protein